MTDRYQGFTSSPIGKVLVKNLGLPNPTRLERYTAGAPLVDGTVVAGGTGRLAESLTGLLDVLGIDALWSGRQAVVRFTPDGASTGAVLKLSRENAEYEIRVNW